MEITIHPEGDVEPHTQFIDPLHLRAFLAEVLPGRPVDPRLPARVAMTQEHGSCPTAGFTGYALEDYFWVETDDLDFKSAGRGQLAIAASSSHRPPSDDHPLFDVVDVLFPLYLALMAVWGGACDRALRPPGHHPALSMGPLEIAEHIVFPTPLAGDRVLPVGPSIHRLPAT